jgi:N-acetylated-alpha-linked acidic dipeptidase
VPVPTVFRISALDEMRCTPQTIRPRRAAPTLPKIPVVAVSATEGEKIRSRLNEGLRVRVAVEMHHAQMPIRNVIATLRGTGEPERWVMLGTHHDAWTFGGVDPGSSAAVLVETARRLAALRRGGWVPQRSIVFAFWDAEEYGLIGSTEFAEDRAATLQNRAVVYINSDMYTPGRLVAGGVPSLRDFVAELTRDVAPDLPRVDELSALGSGADFVAFQDFLGIPTLALEYLFEGGYGFGAYHSSYDSRHYMEQVVDPGFAHGVRLARLLGVGVMRLAAAPVLPFRISHYAERIGGFLRESQTETTELHAMAREIAERARRFEQRLDAALAAERVPVNGAAINDVLVSLERTLLDTSQPPEKRWYRHVIYGWNIYSMYDGQPLPGLFEAIRVRDQAALARERTVIRGALQRMLSGVDALAASLP